MKQITITVLMAFFVALQVFAERVDMREAGVDNQEALKNTEIINNTINRLTTISGEVIGKVIIQKVSRPGVPFFCSSAHPLTCDTRRASI